MKMNHVHFTWRALTTALLLALIVLTSPCSVRNHLERILEVPTTEVSNKSKTATCAAFEQASQNDRQASTLTHLSLEPAPTIEETHSPAFTYSAVPTSHQNELLRTLNVPYYILYGSSKYHL